MNIPDWLIALLIGLVPIGIIIFSYFFDDGSGAIITRAESSENPREYYDRYYRRTK